LLEEVADQFSEEIGNRVADANKPGKNVYKIVGETVKLMVDVEKGGEPEIHEKKADVWRGVDGIGEFTLGGVLLGQKTRLIKGVPDQDELTGDAIDGGEKTLLHPRNTLVIPKNIVHSHRPADGGKAGMLIVKLPLQLQELPPGFGVRGPRQ